MDRPAGESIFKMLPHVRLGARLVRSPQVCCNEKVTQVLIMSEDGREGTLVPWHEGKVISISSSESEILLSVA